MGDDPPDAVWTWAPDKPPRPATAGNILIVYGTYAAPPLGWCPLDEGRYCRLAGGGELPPPGFDVFIEVDCGRLPTMTEGN